MSKRAKFVVGIDLGTTNSVVAYVSLADSEAHTHLLRIEQLTAPGTVERREHLPSFLYVLSDDERRSPALRLPGEAEPHFVVGLLARDLGLYHPERLVSSAKSWLCVQHVDRTSAILPWGAPEEVEKVSPVEASARYLARIAATWHANFPDAPIQEQHVVLTVPASFDPVARGLTVEAARKVGLEDLTLIEEPQAAFYAWLHEHRDSWQESVQLGDVLFVCDVGGGTTDFTAIAVCEQDGQLSLDRVAVGNHILLGGDNMDLALAEAVREELSKQGTRLDPWQQRTLLQACRDAKERLLTAEGLDAVPISIAARGSRLIGGTVRTELRRSLVEKILLDGFFPEVVFDEEPSGESHVLLQEWGLPYASDPAITRHLAHFLRSAATATGNNEPLVPKAVLFNGGVFLPSVLRQRLLSRLAAWFPEHPKPRELQGTNLQHAVALGAASYGWIREHGGVRIRSDLPHSYYVAVAAALPSVPGRKPPLRALCVAPRGLAEGREVDLRNREFALAVGRTLELQVLRSATRQDEVGSLVEEIDEYFEWLPPVRVTLPGECTEERVPVRLRACVNELGVLELWCIERDGPRRWRLEFDLRAVRRGA